MAAQKTTSSSQDKGPLSGLLVLDFARLYPGPLGTRLMALMGARVIKIEDRHHPDPMRFYPPFIDGESAGYLAVNRDKEIRTVDFAGEAGRKELFDLIRQADVLVEQFRPGVMEQLGLGYESVAKENPAIIYASLTGYGQRGPYADQAGHDINYLALAGILAMTGTPQEGPVLPGVQVADVAGGAYWLIMRILAALWQRHRTGRGCYLDVSMLEGVLPLATLQWAQFQAGGQKFGPGQHPLSGALPNYNIYRCKDGRYIALGALEQKFWDAFCDRVKRPEWKPLHFAMGKEGERLKRELEKLFLLKERDEWIAFFAGRDVCLTPVLELDELDTAPVVNKFDWIRRLWKRGK